MKLKYFLTQNFFLNQVSGMVNSKLCRYTQFSWEDVSFSSITFSKIVALSDTTRHFAKCLIYNKSFHCFPVPPLVSQCRMPLSFHPFTSYYGIRFFVLSVKMSSMFVLSQSYIPTLITPEAPGDQCTILLFCMSAALLIPSLTWSILLHLIYLFKYLHFLRSKLEVWIKSIKYVSVILTLLKH